MGKQGCWVGEWESGESAAFTFAVRRPHQYTCHPPAQ